MKVLALIGSLGAGKSSVAESTVRQVIDEGVFGSGRIAYVLNDRPSSDGQMVDGHAVRDIARVIPLPSACFCCDGSESLRLILRDISDGGDIDLVIVEGYGFMSGNDTVAALRRVGYPYEVFALLDSGHFRSNTALYGDVLASHVSAATLGIGLTHIPADGIPEGVDAFVAHRSPNGVRSFPLQKGEGIPGAVVSRLSDGAQPKFHLISTRFVCHSGILGGHDHHTHGHHHTHDYSSVTYRLSSSVTIGAVRGLLLRLGAQVVRAKGIVGSQRFDLVAGEWSVDERQEIHALPLLTLYSRGDGTDITVPEDMIHHEAVTGECASTVDMLREDVLGGDEASAALRTLTDAVPSVPMVLHGEGGLRLAVQCEPIQHLLQIARRPQVIDNGLPAAVEKALRYWIACVEFIRERRSDMDRKHLGVSCRELALSLWWWSTRPGVSVGRDLMGKVADCYVGELLIAGTTDLKCLPSDEDGAAEQAEYYLEALRFAVRCGEDRSVLSDFLQFCCELATLRSGKVACAWVRAKKNFDAP